MTNRNYEFGAEFDMESAGDDNSLRQMDAAIFGQLREAGEGKIIAQPVSIMEIRPDLRQPRRAIPAAIRGRWDGDPRRVVDILDRWRSEASSYLMERFEWKRALEGDDRQQLEAMGNPIVDDLLELVSLAASIHREGLTNPITLIDNLGNGYKVETGERRWLAYHLLDYVYDDGKWAKIPARVVQRDVWRQASENGARKPLNAIGMARQLALLIMDMWADTVGVHFDDYATLVLPGECDRVFYAQVANGQAYQIKRGFAQKVLDVTGLKNRSQISRYRNLLTLDDELWVQADSENWTEGRIRQYLDDLNADNEPDYMLTTVNTSPEHPPTLTQDYGANNGDVLPIGNITPVSERGLERAATPQRLQNDDYDNHRGQSEITRGETDSIDDEEFHDPLKPFADDEMAFIINAMADLALNAGQHNLEWADVERDLRWWSEVTPAQLNALEDAEDDAAGLLVDHANRSMEAANELLQAALVKFGKFQDAVLRRVE